MKRAYQTAFEETFVDDYSEWSEVLDGINSLIQIISETLGQQHRRYSYNEFCCLAKVIIDNKIDEIDWKAMVAKERLILAREVDFKVYARNSKMRIKESVHEMEKDILSLCFEKAMRENLGENIYQMFRNEIESHHKESVL